ncbi:MAG: START domain-containing protein [Smithella sp.]|nr:START domain-containing protein [Smithella sp.]
MKKLTLAFLALLCWTFGMAATAGAAGNWTLIKNSDGIKTYERTDPATDLKEFIAVTTIDARMEVIGEVLRDVAEYPHWISDCVEAELKKKYDRNTFVLYLILNPPLIEKRDIILKDETIYDYENGNAVIKFFSTDDVRVPLKKNHTRVTTMNGLYKMEYMGRNKTKFIYQLKVDPSGSIPKRLAYSVMKKYPHDTLRKLKKIVVNKKYSDMARGSVEEHEIDRRASDENVVKKIFSRNMLRVVENKPALESIIDAEKENMTNIAASGGAYENVHKAAREVFNKYIEKIVTDRKKIEGLKKNKKMTDEITDLIMTYCEASDKTIDRIVAHYNR